MRLQKVTVPPHFAAYCLACGRRVHTDKTGIIADLDGAPFKAYYHPECVKEFPKLTPPEKKEE